MSATPTALRAEPSSPTVRVSHLGSSSGEVRFVARFGSPEWRTETVSDRVYRYPVWPGLESEGEPGAPLLPTRVVRVALPPSASGADPALGIRIGVRPQETGRRASVRFPPSPGWEQSDSRSGTSGSRLVRSAPTEGPTYRDNGAEYAELRSVGIERGLRVANVAVRPVQWDPETETAVWASEITVTLEVSPTGRFGNAGTRIDSASRLSWESTLVNPSAAPGFLAVAPDSVPPAGGIPTNWFDDAPAWLKIHIEKNGVYALTRSDLETAGVPVSQIDPRTLRLYAGSLIPETAWTDLGWDTLATSPLLLASGWNHVYERPGFDDPGFDDPGGVGQIAIHVEGEGDGSFDAGDRVIFYALGPDNYRDRFGLSPDTGEDFVENPYTDHTVYWLAWAGTFNDSPLRMAAVDASPQPAAPVVTTGNASIHFEENTLYAPFLYRAGYRWEQWFWDLLDSFSLGKRFFLDLPHVVAGSTMDTHIRLWGANQPVSFGSGDEILHHVQIDINGADAGLQQWGGPDAVSSLTPHDAFASVPVAAQSEFIFRVPDVPAADPNRFDQVHLVWIDVTYPRFLVLDGEGEDLRIDGGVAGRTVRILSQPALDFAVLDVTDSRQPRRLTGVSVVDNGTDSSVEFAFDRTADGVVAAYSDANPATPAAVFLDTPPRPDPQDSGVRWLRDTDAPLDYVIITRDDMTDEADVLAEWRRSHLYPFTPGRAGRVRVVTVADIMDEFAGGMLDPTAIRHFLEYAYRYYGTPADDDLSYCLFLGDHSYDYRDRLGTGETSVVPSWDDNHQDIFYIDLGSTQYPSDDPLARFDGLFDPVPDLYLGRITASSATEARAVVEDKVIAAEDTPTYGPWRAQCLLVTDDLCQLGNDDFLGVSFTDESEVFDSLLPAVFDREKLPLLDYGETCDILVKPDARADLIASWNAGAWLVNYIGHGNEFYLADERILEMEDIPLLENAGRLPVFVATASRTGKFTLPGKDGLAESLVNSPVGGAVVATGSSSNQTGDVISFALSRNYGQRLFSGGDPHAPASPGSAFMEAKRAAGPESDIYIFFGDPATVPSVPDLPMTVTGPDSLIRGDLAAVSATVSGGMFRDGTVELRAEEPRTFRPVGVSGFERPGEVLFRGPFPVSADTATMSFVVPVSAKAGDDARVRTYAWGADWDALGAIDPIALGGTADPSADTDGPMITFSSHPQRVRVADMIEAVLEDPSGIKLGGPGIEVAVRDAAGTEILRIPATDQFVYDVGNPMRGTVQFAVPDLPFARYTFVLSAEDNYDNPATASTEVELVPNPVSISDVYAYPNPMKNSTTVVFTLSRDDLPVTFRIYSVSGRLVRKESLDAGLVEGRNRFVWDGRDTAGDPVGNGVYLLQISTRATGDPVRHLERLVVLR